MPGAGTDKRTTRRFNLHLPVSVQGPAQLDAQTRDVSSRGICFYTEKHMEPGSPVEFTLTLPPEITMTEAIQVHCKGRVVRVEEATDGRLAIAAQISQYQFIPATD